MAFLKNIEVLGAIIFFRSAKCAIWVVKLSGLYNFYLNIFDFLGHKVGSIFYN